MRSYVVVNRRARHLEREGRLLARIRQPRAGIAVVETTSLEELDAFAEEVAAGDPTAAIVLAGGDGSYMAGVSALARAFARAGTALPPIALAPGGTVCTVARNWAGKAWGIAGQGHYLEALLEGARLGTLRPRRRPTLRVGARADGGERTERVGFIVGAGLVARFFEAYAGAGSGGLVTAAAITLRVFAGSFVGGSLARRLLAPTPCRVELDGRSAPFAEVSLVCASVVRDLGLGMRLLYRAGEEETRFHAVATPLPARALGPQMPLVLAGRPLFGPRLDALATHLTLTFPGGGDGAFVVDGELLHARSVEVTAGPPLVILTP